MSSGEMVLPVVVSQKRILDVDNDIPLDRVHLHRFVLKPTVTIGILASLDPEKKQFVASLVLFRYGEDGDVIDTMEIPFDRMLSSDLVRQNILTPVHEMLDGHFVSGIEWAIGQALIQSITKVSLMYDYVTRRFEALVWTPGDVLEFSVDFNEKVQQYLTLKKDEED